MKVLVVEDDFVSRTLLSEMLTAHGIVHQASNGKEALVAVRKAMMDGDPYHLICLDIIMPGADGHDILKAIRNYENNDELNVAGTSSKIVMVSALKDSRNVLDSFREQADGYLTKPYDETELTKILLAHQLIDA